MTRLVPNTTPAERRRGAIFAENFESPEKVVLNGGVVNGEPVINNGATFDGDNDFILYPTLNINSQITLYARITPTAIGSAMSVIAEDIGGSDRQFQLEINSDGTPQTRIWQSDESALTVKATTVLVAGRTYDLMGVADGSNLRLYVDGVQEGNTIAYDGTIRNEDVSLSIGANGVAGADFTGEIEIAKVFNKGLTAQEALDFKNNATYAYSDNTVVNLQMRAKDHDPTNVQTLDVSGNGNDITFGDGVTSTLFPAKLPKRGYNFDGGDYMLAAGAVNLPLGDSARTVAILVDTKNFGVTQALVAWGTDSASKEFSTEVSAAGAMFINVFAGSFTIAGSVVPVGGIHTIVFVYENDLLRGYVDGIDQGSVATANVDTGDDGTYTIGARNFGLGARLNGNAFQATISDIALTPLQVFDYHINALKSINQT